MREIKKNDISFDDDEDVFELNTNMKGLSKPQQLNARKRDDKRFLAKIEIQQKGNKFVEIDKLSRANGIFPDKSTSFDS